MQARLCELRERENAGRKRAQVYPLRYSEHVFSRRRRDLVAQRAAAQGIFDMASSALVELEDVKIRLQASSLAMTVDRSSPLWWNRCGCEVLTLLN